MVRILYLMYANRTVRYRTVPKTASFLDCRTKSLGCKYCVLGMRVCMQRTWVFWPGVPALVLAVWRTTTSPQAGVCAPFSFAETGFGVSFPVFLLFKRPITKFFLHPLERILFLWLNKKPLKESKELRAALARE